MFRISSFVFGGILGAAAVLGALKYHVVQASDGFHFVPKQKAEFGETYVDIRQFGAEQWQQHHELVAAIVAADREELIGQRVSEQIRQGLNEAIDGLIR